MKKILLFSLSLITLNSCDLSESIPVEGCTDPNAINYNRNADTDNNRCDITGNIIFYMSLDAAIYFDDNNVQKLTFYIDGMNIGSQYNNEGFFYSNSIPSCFDNFFTTGSVYWSGSSYTSINWEAEDEIGHIWYSGTTNIVSNECLSMELT